MKKLFFGIIASGFLILFSVIYSQRYTVQSVPSTNVKDILSNSQLSFFGRLGAGTSAYESLIRLDTGTSNLPSRNTSNLFSDDVIGIGRSSANGLDLYSIRDIANTGAFVIDGTINPANIVTNSMVVATRSAIHYISFTPKSTVTAGVWQFLIKATNGNVEVYNDGIPDQGGFDLGADVGSTTVGLGTRLKPADISCPFGTASIGSTVVIGGSSYNNILCTLAAGATNPVDVAVSLTIGRDLATGSQLINPSPANGRVEGAAGPTVGVYNFYIRHLDAGGNVINTDTAAGKIAVVESVRVTATVDPNLTFTIDNTGVGVGSTVCGNTAFGANAANTTPTAVTFGSLNVNSFNNLAQRLSCITNANSGYVVTVHENSQMKDLNTGSTIPDTTCDAGTCNANTAAAWTTDVSHSKWGYTLQNLTVGFTSTTFAYGNGYKAFGVGFANAKEIMRHNTTPTATEQAYICYRLTASTGQPSGNYENKLTFTATATF